MNPLPTVSQVWDVKYPADLFGPATIARLLDGVKIAANGNVIVGQHRLFALLQLAAKYHRRPENFRIVK